MRWIVGVLLIGAAALKAIELLSEPAVALTSPVGPWFLSAEVGVELGIGLLMLSGLYWRQVRWLALLLFTAFAAYSLSLALGDAASCGCFGSLKVHPWWTFMLDVAIVLGLVVAVWNGRRDPPLERTWQAPFLANRKTAIVAIAGLSVLSAAVLVRCAASRTATAGDLFSTAGELVILEPDQWVGQKLPIAAFIDLDLSQGNWIVLLHRHDCPDCQAAVPRYEEFAIEQQVALVEVPPFGESHAETNGVAQRGRLSDDREWFVQTPVEIQLSDGIVTSASTKLPALHASAGQ